MKPLPWSPTSLDDFVNCPRAFHAKRVEKRFQEEQSEQMIWGTYVHKAFELRQAEGKPLPQELEHHEAFMLRLALIPGQQWTERQVGLSKKGQPCGFFDKENVWFRCVIDFTKVDDKKAMVVDYKTGKPHTKFKQLKLNALHIFAEFPSVEEIEVKYYWTKTETTTGERYTRDQIGKLWGEFMPDLKQYASAFKNDIWQPRQSGLCNGWCPVSDCEFWKPKRVK